MKTKYFLRGLGTGIVLATIVCLIAFNVDMSKSELEEKSTKEQSTMFDNESTDEFESDANDEGNSKEATSEEITTPENVTVPEIETTVSENETNIPEIETTTIKVDGALGGLITVSPGMTSEAVSSLLQANGIIGDANDFNNFLTNAGYATTIHVGTFEIPAGSDYESIARTIAGR